MARSRQAFLAPRLSTGLKVNRKSFTEFGNAHVVVGPSIADAIEAFDVFQQHERPRASARGSKSNYITCDLLLYGWLHIGAVCGMREMCLIR